MMTFSYPSPAIGSSFAGECEIRLAKNAPNDFDPHVAILGPPELSQ